MTSVTVVVAEERLERPVAEDVVGDLADELATLLAGQRRAVEGELLGDRPQDALGDVGGAVVCANSSGPSCAMQAWWMRVFSSAYGSARRSPSRVPRGVAGASAVGSELSSYGRRCCCSGRPSGGPGGPSAQLLSFETASTGTPSPSPGLPSPSPGRCTPRPVGQRRGSPSRSPQPGSASTTGLPRLTAIGTARSLGSSTWTFVSSVVLDLAALQPDLRVGAVQDDADPLGAGRRAARASAGRAGRSSSSGRRARRGGAARRCGRASPASARGRTATCRRRSRRRTRGRPRAAGPACASVTSSASSGRSGAGRTSSPHGCLVV